MKYVWASWGSNTTGHFSKGENINTVKTRHIRGYGCAVTFTSTRMAWSSAEFTYSLASRYVGAAISRD